MNDIVHIAKRIAEFFGSFLLAVIVLLFLLVLTYFGTLDQANMSLLEAQRKYFESWVVKSRYFILPIPGAQLLLTVLFFNLLIGGMLRLRRSWSRAGVFVIHIGIAMLLLGGLIEYNYSRKGQMKLYEGQSADYFSSTERWEVAVLEPTGDGEERAYVIPFERFNDLGDGQKARYTAEGLPFTLELSGYLANCEPSANDDAPDGIGFKRLPPPGKDQMGLPGVTATVIAKSGQRQTALLWGFQTEPWIVEVDGRKWGLDMRGRQWDLPFRVKLRDFQHAFHAGTGTPARFSSDITRYDADNVSEEIHISMNEPMRHAGFTFYQSGWGPSNARAGSAMYSVFAVVDNPTDQVPLYACILIALGLLFQFGYKLTKFTQAEMNRHDRETRALLKEEQEVIRAES